MGRATITIILPEINDDDAIQVKKEIEKLLEAKPNVTVSVHIMPR